MFNIRNFALLQFGTFSQFSKREANYRNPLQQQQLLYYAENEYINYQKLVRLKMKKRLDYVKEINKLFQLPFIA